MRSIAILPVKRFDAAKQRLAEVLGAGSRQALAQAMYQDVLGSLRRVPGLDAIIVVTADPVAEVTARAHRLPVLRDAQVGQSSAAEVGIAYALAHGFDQALLVPGDTPLLDPAEVGSLLRSGRAEALDLVLVPDHHGEGTNAVLLDPPDALPPAFGPGSLERHLRQARAAGLSFRVEGVESLSRDVDTPEDLAELWSALDERRGLAPHTRGALRQLDRSRVYGSAQMARVRDRVRAEGVPPWS